MLVEPVRHLQIGDRDLPSAYHGFGNLMEYHDGEQHQGHTYRQVQAQLAFGRKPRRQETAQLRGPARAHVFVIRVSFPCHCCAANWYLPADRKTTENKKILFIHTVTVFSYSSYAILMTRSTHLPQRNCHGNIE